MKVGFFSIWNCHLAWPNQMAEQKLYDLYEKLVCLFLNPHEEKQPWKPSLWLCEIPSRDSIFRTRQLGRNLLKAGSDTQPAQGVQGLVLSGVERLQGWSLSSLIGLPLCMGFSFSPAGVSPGSQEPLVPHHAALMSLALSPGCPPQRLLWEPLDMSIIQAEQAQLPQASALTILAASACSFPSVLRSGWNLGAQRWRQCCAADYGVDRGVQSLPSAIQLCSSWCSPRAYLAARAHCLVFRLNWQLHLHSS